MGKKQALALATCNVVIYAGISGLIGLLPVYLTELGADSSLIGIFLATVYLSLAVSNIVAGRLSDRFQHRKWLLILGGLAAAPLAWGMSQASTIPLLLALMVCLWFVIGIAMTMLSILTGLFAKAGRQGRSFGMLSLSSSIGLFTGSVASGRIVDRWGFPMLFTLLAIFYLVIPIAGAFVQDRVVPPEKKLPGGVLPGGSIRRLFANHTFTLMFVACSLAQSSNIVIALSRPLMMNELAFSATAIGIAAAVGSLVTLPLPLVIGWLTDRIGRKPLLAACFVAPALGLIVLASAVAAWQFWLSSIFGSIVGASTVVGSAVILEIFPEKWWGSSLALMNATPWIGIVIGFSAGGVAIRMFQMTPALLLALLPCILAIVLLTRMAARPAVYAQGK